MFDRSVSIKYIKSYKFLKPTVLKALSFRIIHTYLQVFKIVTLNRKWSVH